ncbi:uncharacterized protein LOC123536637 [Mercenaria mercenaria]|uniref:uncharacterized protein LOC123536637 n=1 Tax=Mercenaria mercenaria TaxID=6596 RepID=UPI00234E92F5|nr:uncharacterized protein LOC123536637 [Mercenaria mercenaria]
MMFKNKHFTCLTFIYVCSLFGGISGFYENETKKELLKDVTNIRARFLVFVSAQLNNCNATAASPYLKPGQNFSTAPVLNVSTCDQGPLMYKIQANTKSNIMTVTVTFGTSLYFGPPPSCSFHWKGGYQNPTAKHMELSPLPGCHVQVTDKESNKTYLIFQLLMWQWF